MCSNKITMKKLTILLITFISFIGCRDGKSHIVESKRYLNNGICGYYYNDGFGSPYTEDSCNKYSVGDTIIFKNLK